MLILKCITSFILVTSSFALVVDSLNARHIMIKATSFAVAFSIIFALVCMWQ